MTHCTNCNGEGLAGQGDKPWLKEGAVSTCNHCEGTGQIQEGGTPNATENDSEEKAVKSPEEGAVDNSAPTEQTPSEETPAPTESVPEVATEASNLDQTPSVEEAVQDLSEASSTGREVLSESETAPVE